MKFTLSWLAEHLDTQASVQEIADSLTDSGLEVEETAGPSAEYRNFSICRVIEAFQHPNADRLKVCRVETWPDGPEKPGDEVQVVCGAPNARTGMKGVFAPIGTVIPGTGMLLKKGVIRGVESGGMLCSERELKISDEHEGIIDLPEDAPLGAAFMDYAGLNDPVIEIAVTPNRPDALGVRGIARDLAARGLGRLKPMAVEPVAGRFPCPVSVKIDDDAKPDHCPVFFGRVIRGVTNGDSPEWMRRRLEAIGLRPISALVDITNYVTYDQNRPLHVFDADKLKGGLRIHLAEGGESLAALDGCEHEFERGQIMISDEGGPESIAGIMGGLPSGCTEKTVNVFIESALWDPTVTAATGRRMKINSDARYRFERGVDPEFTRPGLDLATGLVLDICGGEPSDTVSDGQVPDTSRSFKLRTDRVKRLVGMDVPPARQEKILVDLGFSVEHDGGGIVAAPPSWRPDIHGEADLVEEIARIASLTGLEGKPLPRRAPGIARQILLPAQKRALVCRRTIASLGYDECVTYSFVGEDIAEMFLGGTKPVEIENPISSDLGVMRPDLLPGLLKAALSNQSRGFNDLALFEVGPVFHGPAAGAESLCAAGLLIGSRAPRQPHSSPRQVDLYDAKADAETALSAMVPAARFRHSRDVPSWMHPGRSGSLSLQPGKPLAVFGELNPKLLQSLGVKGAAVAFTLFLDALPKPKSRGKTRAAFAPSPLQHVDRDFAFVLETDVEAAEVTAAVQRTRFRNLIRRVQVFDEYSGSEAEAQFGEGRKSLAVAVRLQPKDAPLKDAELEMICADIAGQVEKATGGQLRN